MTVSDHRWASLSMRWKAFRLPYLVEDMLVFPWFTADAWDAPSLAWTMGFGSDWRIRVGLVCLRVLEFRSSRRRSHAMFIRDFLTRRRR